MTIGILGAGTWGIALARMLHNIGHRVTVWSALESEIESYKATHRQPNLPGMVIPEGIVFTADIAEAAAGKEILLFAVPSVYTRSTAAKAAPYIPDGQIIVDVAKGIEAETLLTLTQVIDDELRRCGKNARLVALSGPTHAEEVALDLPTTIVAACADLDTAELVQDAFMNTCMRVYTNCDVIGVELCGAIKNIMALAAGISQGLGYGDNTKAALITRGMAEITRLGMAIGCKSETCYGLAGIGQQILTATSAHSRNNRCGRLIGAGVPTAEAVKQVGMVVEGINAIPAAMKLAERYSVEMPIVRAVDAVVNHGADARTEVLRLMLREKNSETPKSHWAN